MPSIRALILGLLTFILHMATFASPGPAFAASKEKVLHEFTLQSGITPTAALTLGSNGNLYGTTSSGGGSHCTVHGGCGTVFQLTVGKNGKWSERVLHSFRSDGRDGVGPGSGVIFDSLGNLFGTTLGGGADGAGTVFELMPDANGEWTEKLLHTFNSDGKDGTLPLAGVTFDTDGNVYGTTEAGGVYNDGTVFRLTPSKDGKWRETLLHSFVDNGKDGNSPDAGLIFDIAGNLYGTTVGGGGGACTGGCGTVFELVRDGNGGWTEKVLHRFSHGYDKDGYYPTANLILDAKGGLYGTTNGGGSFGEGTVFRLTHRANGEWTEKVLHSFDWNGKDGYYPDASLIFDASGNLYGATSLGGTGQCTLIGIIVGCGTVFRLMPDANGRWNERILHNFQSNGKDGTEPNAGLALDGAGNLYGTTTMGGSDLCSDDGCGTVFEITP